MIDYMTVPPDILMEISTTSSFVLWLRTPRTPVMRMKEDPWLWTTVTVNTPWLES